MIDTSELSQIEISNIQDKLTYLIQHGYIDPVRKNEVYRAMVSQKIKDNKKGP